MAPDTPGVRVHCPTRWTVRADSLKSILGNFEVLQELWEEAIDLVKDTEMKARINGVAYYFGICLGHLILKLTDDLSLIESANRFIHGRDHREQIFGKFVGNKCDWNFLFVNINYIFLNKFFLI